MNAKTHGPKRETLKAAGYTHERTIEKGMHLLKDESGKLEIWQANKNHASYGLIYGNTHLEFVRSVAGHVFKQWEKV
jgi:hypothetical protein